MKTQEVAFSHVIVQKSKKDSSLIVARTGTNGIADM